jgi:alpha-beta hydrolase superfamily lysophospholipase
MLLATAPATFAEEPVTAPVSGGHLSGTLLLPPGNGPFPVALIIAGSGPTDRDGNYPPVLKTDAYKKLAQGLAARGIATLRYDKRGIGTSSNTQTEKDVRFDDFVNDALALTKVLEADKRFSSVSIIGHSEGSLIGMVAAAQDAHVGAFVSLEGAGRDLATIINAQVAAGGASQAIVDEVSAINASLVAGKTVPSPDPQLLALFRPSVQPYLISEYRHDPAVDIVKLTIPTLIVQGTTDIQVGVADAKLLAGAAPKAKLVLIDGMNHILRDAPLDRAQNIATYSDPTLPLNAKVVPAIADFILGASAGH